MVCYKNRSLALSNDMKCKAWALQGRKSEDLNGAISNGDFYPTARPSNMNYIYEETPTSWEGHWRNESQKINKFQLKQDGKGIREEVKKIGHKEDIQ